MGPGGIVPRYVIAFDAESAVHPLSNQPRLQQRRRRRREIPVKSSEAHAYRKLMQGMSLSDAPKWTRMLGGTSHPQTVTLWHVRAECYRCGATFCLFACARFTAARGNGPPTVEWPTATATVYYVTLVVSVPRQSQPAQSVCAAAVSLACV